MKKFLLLIVSFFTFNAVASPLVAPLFLLGAAAVAYSVEELSSKGIGASVDALRMSLNPILGLFVPMGSQNMTAEEKQAGWTQKSDGTLQPPASSGFKKFYSTSSSGYLSAAQSSRYQNEPSDWAAYIQNGWTRTDYQRTDSSNGLPYTIVRFTKKDGSYAASGGIYNECSAGYNISASGCTLDPAKASLVALPNDKICKIVRSASSFSFDKKDPDCDTTGLANAGIVLNGKVISQAVDGRYIAVVSNDDGTFMIQDKERKTVGSLTYTKTDTAVLSPSTSSSTYTLTKFDSTSEVGDKTTTATTAGSIQSQASVVAVVDNSKLEALVDPISKEFSKPLQSTNDLPDNSKFSDSWFEKITFKQDLGECKPLVVHFMLRDNEINVCNYVDMIKTALTFMMYVLGPFALWRVARGKGE